MPEQPRPELEDADTFFRAWKIYKTEADESKRTLFQRFDWQNKCTEHQAFLSYIATKTGMKTKMLGDMDKCMWSMTHTYALLLCEAYWSEVVVSPTHAQANCSVDILTSSVLSLFLTAPESVVPRKALSSLLNEEDKKTVAQLALWVWEKRFLESPYQSEMGGRLCIDILEVHYHASERRSHLRFVRCIAFSCLSCIVKTQIHLHPFLTAFYPPHTMLGRVHG